MPIIFTAKLSVGRLILLVQFPLKTMKPNDAQPREDMFYLEWLFQVLLSENDSLWSHTVVMTVAYISMAVNFVAFFFLMRCSIPMYVQVFVTISSSSSSLLFHFLPLLNIRCFGTLAFRVIKNIKQSSDGFWQVVSSPDSEDHSVAFQIYYVISTGNLLCTCHLNFPWIHHPEFLCKHIRTHLTQGLIWHVLIAPGEPLRISDAMRVSSSMNWHHTHEDLAIMLKIQ